MSGLETENICKAFGKVKALVNVSISIQTNEIVAVVGDNGAGKSTLINVLSGHYAPDSGQINVFGERFRRLNTALAIQKGITTVYQDLALVNCRDVMANLFMGREPVRGGFWIRRSSMEKEANRILKSLNIKIPSVYTKVGMLSGGQRQGIAIARAILQGGKIHIFDEPTAAMGIKESTETLNRISSLRSLGMGVLLVSHNLQHVFSLADRIYIMRHGYVVGNLQVSAVTPSEVVELMTGINSMINNYGFGGTQDVV